MKKKNTHTQKKKFCLHSFLYIIFLYTTFAEDEQREIYGKRADTVEDKFTYAFYMSACFNMFFLLLITNRLSVKFENIGESR